MRTSEADTTAEGTWFAVPLPKPKGGYALGRVARTSADRGIVLAYFFGPRVAALPRAEDAVGVVPESAVLIRRVSSRALCDGTWPVVTRSEAGWPRETWTMPRFGRVSALDGRYYYVEYDSDDPGRTRAEVRASAEDVEHLFPDVLSGPRGVVAALDRTL